jgi:hypothetical protein
VLDSIGIGSVGDALKWVTPSGEWKWSVVLYGAGYEARCSLPVNNIDEQIVVDGAEEDRLTVRSFRSCSSPVFFARCSPLLKSMSSTDVSCGSHLMGPTCESTTVVNDTELAPTVSPGGV